MQKALLVSTITPKPEQAGTLQTFLTGEKFKHGHSQAIREASSFHCPRWTGQTSASYPGAQAVSPSTQVLKVKNELFLNSLSNVFPPVFLLWAAKWDGQEGAEASRPRRPSEMETPRAIGKSHRAEQPVQTCPHARHLILKRKRNLRGFCKSSLLGAPPKCTNPYSVLCPVFLPELHSHKPNSPDLTVQLTNFLPNSLETQPPLIPKGV